MGRIEEVRRPLWMLRSFSKPLFDLPNAQAKKLVELARDNTPSKTAKLLKEMNIDQKILQACRYLACIKRNHSIEEFEETVEMYKKY